MSANFEGQSPIKPVLSNAQQVLGKFKLNFVILPCRAMLPLQEESHLWMTLLSIFYLWHPELFLIERWNAPGNATKCFFLLEMKTEGQIWPEFIMSYTIEHHTENLDESHERNSRENNLAHGTIYADKHDKEISWRLHHYILVGKTSHMFESWFLLFVLFLLSTQDCNYSLLNKLLSLNKTKRILPLHAQTFYRN